MAWQQLSLGPSEIFIVSDICSVICHHIMPNPVHVAIAFGVSEVQECKRFLEQMHLDWI